MGNQAGGEIAEPRRASPSAHNGAAVANAQGVESLNKGQIDEAIKLFKTALEYEPASVQILNNIGLAYAKQQDFDGAFEWYEKAYDKDPSDLETVFSLAWVQRKRHEFPHATELFRKVQLRPRPRERAERRRPGGPRCCSSSRST